MSSHTWTYRKIKVAEDVQQRMKDKFEEKYNNLFTKSNQELYDIYWKEMYEQYPDVDKKFFEPRFSVQDYAEDLNRIREEVKKENVLEQVRNNNFEHAQLLIDFEDFIDNSNGEIIQFYKDAFYINDDSIGMDLFRVDYNEKVFSDAESLIEWLSTQKYVGFYDKEYNNLGFCDKLCQKIRKLFAKHPDIIIDFG